MERADCHRSCASSRRRSPPRLASLWKEASASPSRSSLHRRPSSTRWLEIMAEDMAQGRALPIEPPTSYLEGDVEAPAVEDLLREQRSAVQAGTLEVGAQRSADQARHARLRDPRSMLDGDRASSKSSSVCSSSIPSNPSLPRALRSSRFSMPRQATGLGCHLFSLAFSDVGDLPSGLRSDAMKHGWRVAASNAYPSLMALEAGEDGEPLPRPPRARDYEIANVLLPSLLAFLVKACEHVGRGRAGVRVVLRRVRSRGPIHRALPRRPALRLRRL